MNDKAECCAAYVGGGFSAEEGNAMIAGLKSYSYDRLVQDVLDAIKLAFAYTELNEISPEETAMVAISVVNRAWLEHMKTFGPMLKDARDQGILDTLIECNAWPNPPFVLTREDIDAATAEAKAALGS